jgi:fructoselysine-6-P-deglycase FrlB-like protein
MSLTYDEIMAQYGAMRETAAHIDAKWGEIAPLFAKRPKLLAAVGCGSSYSVAKSIADMARMHSGVPAAALAAGDLLLHAERYAPLIDGATVLAVSRSGSTSEILLAAERLRALGCRFSLLSVVCVSGSPLGAISDYALELPWAFDRSVCQTRTVACMYYAFAHGLAKWLGDATLLADLGAVAELGPVFARRVEPALAELAGRPWTHAVVLGDAELAGLAEEGALAFKEICQLPSSHHHLLDARHGPMVLFGDRTLILAAVGEDGPYASGMLRDLVRKGSEVVAFADEGIDFPGGTAIAFGRKLSHIARGLPFLLLCQLLAYFKAAGTGADPDAPTGLSPWIEL